LTGTHNVVCSRTEVELYYLPVLLWPRSTGAEAFWTAAMAAKGTIWRCRNGTRSLVGTAGAAPGRPPCGGALWRVGGDLALSSSRPRAGRVVRLRFYGAQWWPGRWQTRAPPRQGGVGPRDSLCFFFNCDHALTVFVWVVFVLLLCLSTGKGGVHMESMTGPGI